MQVIMVWFGKRSTKTLISGRMKHLFRIYNISSVGLRLKANWFQCIRQKKSTGSWARYSRVSVELIGQGLLYREAQGLIMPIHDCLMTTYCSSVQTQRLQRPPPPTSPAYVCVYVCVCNIIEVQSLTSRSSLESFSKGAAQVLIFDE